MHSPTGNNFLPNCSIISNVPEEVPVSSCFQVSSSWRECSPTPSVSVQKPTDFIGPVLRADNAQLKDSLSSSRPLSSLLANTKQPRALTLSSRTPVCHGSHLCQLGDPLNSPELRLCLPLWSKSLPPLPPHGTGPNSSRV